MTAKAGGKDDNGPDYQTAPPEPGRTQAAQPKEAAHWANRQAGTEPEQGTNRQAGEGRCPADGARQAQTEPAEDTRQTTRPEKRAGTEKKEDDAMRHPQSQDPSHPARREARQPPPGAGGTGTGGTRPTTSPRAAAYLSPQIL